jgi:hypothetical protein
MKKFFAIAAIVCLLLLGVTLVKTGRESSAAELSATELSVAEGTVYRVASNLTPEYSCNHITLGRVFMMHRGEDGNLVSVIPVAETDRTLTEVTYLCKDGSFLIIEGDAVTESP